MSDPLSIHFLSLVEPIQQNVETYFSTQHR